MRINDGCERAKGTYHIALTVSGVVCEVEPHQGGNAGDLNVTPQSITPMQRVKIHTKLHMHTKVDVCGSVAAGACHHGTISQACSRPPRTHVIRVSATHVVHRT